MLTMRSPFACAVATLLLSHVLTSFAAPAASVSRSERSHDFDNHAWVAPVERRGSTTGRDVASSLDFNVLKNPSTNQAVVVTSCQGCSADGADVHLALDFQLVQNSVQECAAAFILNGSTFHLSRSTPSTSFQVRSANADAYLLRADISCVPEDQQPSVEGPVISVQVKAVGDRPPKKITGFEVRTSPQASILRLEPLSSGRSDRTSGRSAIAPLGRGHIVDAPSVSTFLSPASFKADSNSTEECDHYRCPLHSLLHNIRNTFKGDRFERFKSRVQSVMIDAKITLGCHPTNVTDEKAQVSTDNRLSILFTGPVQNDGDALKKILDTQTPLVIALEALASVLGLGGLFYFLRKRCCSLRRRVERLADREERMKAREYRRAARREAWRRRWMSFKRTCMCCFGSYECEPEDEEKQGLVSNAAANGSSGDLQASMAQLEGLEYAREVVAEMIRKRGGVANQPGMSSTNDFAYPADIAFNFTNTRSRASSLPSYNSDVLPDYSSQPDSADMARHVRVINNYRRSGSPVSSTGSSRYTPDSSIPEISPRPSQETLRTQSER